MVATLPVGRSPCAPSHFPSLSSPSVVLRGEEIIPTRSVGVLAPCLRPHLTHSFFILRRPLPPSFPSGNELIAHALARCWTYVVQIQTMPFLDLHRYLAGPPALAQTDADVASLVRPPPGASTFEAFERDQRAVMARTLAFVTQSSVARACGA